MRNAPRKKRCGPIRRSPTRHAPFTEPWSARCATCGRGLTKRARYLLVAMCGLMLVASLALIAWWTRSGRAPEPQRAHLWIASESMSVAELDALVDPIVVEMHAGGVTRVDSVAREAGLVVTIFGEIDERNVDLRARIRPRLAHLSFPEEVETPVLGAPPGPIERMFTVRGDATDLAPIARTLRRRLE